MSASEQTLGYPSIKLERAVERARKIYEIDPSGTSSVPAEDLRAAWEFGAQTSNFPQTVNALKGYGIIDTSRPTASGASLTNAAIEFFESNEEKERLEAIRGFALAPPMMRNLWETWGVANVPLTVAVKQLRNTKGLSEKAAKAVHGIYFANLIFANLADVEEAALPEGIASQYLHVRRPVPVSIANGHVALKTDDIQVALSGKRIRIVADVDATGLKKLKEVIDKYEEILRILD